MDNPFSGLLRSRKFWIMLVDVLGSLVTYFAVKYANPSLAEDVKMVLAGLQPAIIAVIASIAAEDVAHINAAVKYDVANLAAEFADNSDCPESEG